MCEIFSALGTAGAAELDSKFVVTRTTRVDAMRTKNEAR